MDGETPKYPPLVLASGEIDDGELHRNIADRQCTARAKSTNNQCRQPSVPGATVCVYHGGSAPQVRMAGMRRLLAAVDPALEELVDLVGDMDKNISLRACLAILEKAGVGAAAKIVVGMDVPNQPTERPEVDAMIEAALDERWREYEERKKLRAVEIPASSDEARPA